MDEREQRILNAASELIVHYGYDKTTVSDIAREAGVSKGAIYLHFDSKEELFETLLKRELAQYQAEWVRLIEADPNGGTMAGLYKNILFAMSSSDFLMAIFKRDGRILGSYLRKPDNLFESNQGTSLRKEFLDMMQQAGAIRADVDTRIYAHIMNMLAYELISMEDVMDADDIPPLEEIIEGIAEVLDRAMTPSDSAGVSEKGKAIVRQLLASVNQQADETP